MEIKTDEERLKKLREELSKTKVNKRTEAAVGLLKARIARLEDEIEKKKAKKKGKGEGFAVKKEGDATVAFLGLPSVGKSTLLTKLTNKESKTGHYNFTTLNVVPGLLYYNFTNIQLLDLPGITSLEVDRKGFGKKIFSVVRSADLVLLVVDVENAIKELEIIFEASKELHILFNKKKPNIKIIKKDRGKIQIPLNNSKETLSKEFIVEVLENLKYKNVEVSIYDKGLTPEDFVNASYDNIIYKKGLIVLNKVDKVSKEKLEEIKKKIKKKWPEFNIVSISANNELNLDILKEEIWKELGFIWIYLKEKKKEPDFSKPLILKKNSTIRDVCNKIHKSFLENFKYAKLQTANSNFEWKKVGLNVKVNHKDIVEISLK